ncbi:triphosphoribosyl-dephospho-CoA synthase [Candidatus Laterigemmans baculatus]|uniref:triphosphoribosyl-dephospho-CoA synthase n=1 Tax=Candidatus Laterigemmans baculatus TaxID=2770505 RepID=UPI0013DA33C4|nr:triphosphoribosyl-dephospho-CoA synthase [Candidatus Laterigemmans baculatus]
MSDAAQRSPADRGPRPSVSELLRAYRQLAAAPGDRVRWACTLEAVAPKLGNVHPSASFADLRLSDFVTAAEQLATVVEEAADAPGRWSLGAMVLEAVKRCRERTGTNVNLGIALLIVPLVLAERVAEEESLAPAAAVQAVLDRLDAADGRDVYAAIRLAQPGGLGRASEMDVNAPAGGEIGEIAATGGQASVEASPPVDLLAAMHGAADRDAIAHLYATGFDKLFELVTPWIEAAIGDVGDWLLGIREAQLRLLAAAPDTLIARKCGPAVALEGQRLAAEVFEAGNAAERSAAEERLDQWLRADGHRRNPGTTADVIAAGLYVLLSPILLSRRR